MQKARILAAIDHTVLSPTTTWEDVYIGCREGVIYHPASVYVPSVYVRQAREGARGGVKIGTMIGFPYGHSTMESKCVEATEAVRNGASELDMAIQLGWLKDKRYNDVLREIATVKQICGNRPLKVIAEACLLTEEQKLRMCDIVSRSGADYIQTSTGLYDNDAILEEIAFFRSHLSPRIMIKVAGDFISLQDAEELISIGVSRIGSNRLLKELNNLP